MTEHFNRLSEGAQERLVLVAEECGEVIQAIGKILRHGYESEYNNETNRQALERELGDLFHAVKRMCLVYELNEEAITARVVLPKEKKAYLHHQ